MKKRISPSGRAARALLVPVMVGSIAVPMAAQAAKKTFSWHIQEQPVTDTVADQIVAGGGSGSGSASSIWTASSCGTLKDRVNQTLRGHDGKREAHETAPLLR
jgi:hypothetical protein